MRKIYFGMSVLLVMLVWGAVNSYGQVRYVDVVPGIGTLNEAISGDTTETGERVDAENTVYRLERGDVAYYGLTGSIENSGYPLTIVAADGDGARPFLQPVDEGSGSSRPFRPRGDITLKGLHVTNLDDLGGYNDRILRCSADDIRVILDDCWFDRDAQSMIRCDNPGLTIKITNCTISNIGRPNSPSNGRVIDDRGNAIDTVIIENSTIYNITQRIIRDDGGELTYCRFVNNTFNNVGQIGVTFGPTGTLVLQNNIFRNFGFMPTDILDPSIVFSVDSVGGVAPVIDARNNNVSLDTALVAPYLNDTLILPVIMNPTFFAYMVGSGNIATMLNENFEFNDGPVFNDSLIIYDINPDFDQNNAPDWVDPEIPGDGLYFRVLPYDFGWVNSKAFVAGTDGMQLGDRNWTADRDVMGLVDFESFNERLFWVQMANAGDDPQNMMLAANPDMSGINTSSQVMMYSVQAGADPWAGAYSDAQGYMTFTEEKHHMEMMVYKDVISNCGLKVEVGGTATELKVPNTVTNEWELITFDFSASIGQTLTRLVFFPDFPETRTAGSLAYVDNIQIVSKSATSVENTREQALRIYPNPAVDYLTIDQEGIDRILIRDILGKAVRSMELQRVDMVNVPVGDLVEGIYFITVESESGSVTSKFLKR